MGALLSVLCVLLLQATPATAQNLQSKLDTKKAQLDQVRGKKGVLTTAISHYSNQINLLEGQVAALRNHEAAVQHQLEAKQAELDRAAAALAKEQKHLRVLRLHLRRALIGLRQRLVSMYESGSPDILTVILNSDGWSDLVTRTEYLNSLQNQDQLLVVRVRDLRDQTRATVERLRAAKDRIQAARDAIAAQKAQLEQTRSSLESRQSDLTVARSQRQHALSRIKDQERAIGEDVSSLQGQIQRQISQASSVTPLPAGPIRGGSSGLIWPVNGSITSCFCMRWGRMHEGIDIAAAEGTPIRAAASGQAVLAAYTGGYGNYTCIDHGGGLSTCYAHQSGYAVSAGESVGQGQVIGYVGSTGESTGPHLHFEVRVNGAAVDPLGYL